MSPSCFVCSLKPYSPVGVSCIIFFFVLSKFFLSCPPGKLFLLFERGNVILVLCSNTFEIKKIKTAFQLS